MTGANTPLRLLHLHSSFSLGGKEARAVRLMNLMGPRARHTILSAVPKALGARDAIDPGIDVEFPGDRAPPLHGKPGLARHDGQLLGIGGDGQALRIVELMENGKALDASQLQGLLSSLPDA